MTEPTSTTGSFSGSSNATVTTPRYVAASSLGPLAAALAKAQAEFGTVVRDKTVTVQTKTGGSYTFSYAPLESILAAVRGPLAANGLSIVQMLDDGALATLLLHESGGVLSSRMALPSDLRDLQALGSAMTYLRRYAIQGMLGIAAEDDDDGNRATGNVAVPVGVQHGDDGSLIGVVSVGDKSTSDYSVRQTPDGPVLGYRLLSDKGDKGGILVEARGPLAVQLDEHRDRVVGARVTVWGSIEERSFMAGKVKRTYQALAADRVAVPILGLLPVAVDPTLPMFDENEQAAIDDALGLVP